MKDHNEVFTRVLKQRDEYIRNQKANKTTADTAETKPRVNFARWGTVMAAACLVAVVAVTLRFAPGILKLDLPIETDGPGEELNQIAETNAGTGETSGQPAETDAGIGETSNQPTETDVGPGKTPNQPAETNAVAVETSGQPAETDVGPGETPNQPTETNAGIGETSNQPAETNAVAVETSGQPAETNAVAVETSNPPAETDVGPGETPNQPAETDLETTGDEQPIMIRLWDNVSASASGSSVPPLDPTLNTITTFPVQNEEGKDLVVVEYYLANEINSVLEEQYGYDPRIYGAPFRLGELISFFFGKENTTFAELTEEEQSFLRRKNAEYWDSYHSLAPSIWEGFLLQIK